MIPIDIAGYDFFFLEGVGPTPVIRVRAGTFPLPGEFTAADRQAAWYVTADGGLQFVINTPEDGYLLSLYPADSQADLLVLRAMATTGRLGFAVPGAGELLVMEFCLSDILKAIRHWECLHAPVIARAG